MWAKTRRLTDAQGKIREEFPPRLPGNEGFPPPRFRASFLTMSRRIFIGAKPSAKLVEQVLAWQKNWQTLPVRWLTEDQFHITVVPPWNERNIDELKNLLKPQTLAPIPIHFAKVSFGPSPLAPRLVWAEGPALAELVTLKDSLEKTLGLEPMRRAFTLHLTLARFRPEDFVNFPVKHLEEQVDWQDSISSFALIESFLKPDGVEYQTLATYDL